MAPEATPPAALSPALLAALSEALGTPFAPDEDGHAAYTADANVLWQWQTHPDGRIAQLYAVLHTLPPDQAAGLALMALAANLPGAGLDGAALGYSPSQEVLALSQQVVLAEDPSATAARVLGFVERAIAWRNHLADWLEATPQPAQASAAEPGVTAPLDTMNWVNLRA
jgi:hypothetical protein